MTWLLVRSHRGALLALGAYAIGAVVLAAWAHGNEVNAVAACQSQLALCRAATDDLTAQLSILAPVIVLPALIGTFLGAPLVARELESGTYRLAWTQGVTRRRWLALQLSFLVAVTVVVVAVVAGAATGADHVGPPTSFQHFDSNGIVPVGYALFALTLGVAIGVTTRRTVLSMGLTGAVFIATRLGVFVARPNFVAPVTLVYGHGGPPSGSPSSYGGLILSQGYVTSTGKHIRFLSDPEPWHACSRRRISRTVVDCECSRPSNPATATGCSRASSSAFSSPWRWRRWDSPS